MPEMIKVHLTFNNPPPSGESLWAIGISNNTAKIDNIPFFTDDFTLGDLIEFDPFNNNEIIRVIEKGAKTYSGFYEPLKDEEETVKLWKKIVSYLKEYDIKCEGAFPGMFRMSVPLDIDLEQLKSIFVTSQIPSLDLKGKL